MAAFTEAVETADTGATPNASGSFTPVVGDLLVVVVQCAASLSDADDVPTASANGITFVRAVHGIYRTSLDSIDIYVARQFVPSSPASMTVTWTPTDAGDGTVIGVYRVSGMSRCGPKAIRQVANTNNGAAAGTPAITFAASCLTGNPTLVAIGNSTNPAGITPPGSWTETTDTGYATPTSGCEVATRASGFTGTTVTWGGTSASTFGAVGIELDATTDAGPLLDGNIIEAETAGSSTTTASRNIASGGRDIWLFVTHNRATVGTVTSAITDNSGGALTWELVKRQNGGASAGVTAEIWRAWASGSITGLTVTATGTGGTVTMSHITMAVFSGTEQTYGGQTNGASSASGLPSAALTTSRANSLVWGVKADWAAAGTGTPNTLQSLINTFHNSVEYTSDAWQRNQEIPAASTSVTLNETAPAAQNFHMAIAEIRVAGATVSLTPVDIPLVAVALNPVPGMVTVGLTVAVASLTAQVLNPVPGVVTVNLTPAVITITAIVLDPVGGAGSTVDLTPAVFSLSAVIVTPVPGVVAVSLATAVVSLSAITLSPIPGVVVVELTVAILTLSAEILSPVPGIVSTTLTPALLTLTAIALTPGAAASFVDLVTAVINFEAVPLSPVGDPNPPFSGIPRFTHYPRFDLQERSWW